MDRFLEIQTFNAVVDAGSFVKAADALAMSKAAVSRYIVDMEARLGVRLLHRTTRRLSLTDEGQIFYVRSKELLAELAEAEDEITSRSGAASGLLRVNAPFTFGVLHLAPLWGAFRAQHPKVKLDVTLADRLVDLVDEGYDVAIRIANLENSSLVSKRLATTRMVLCASPGYLLRHGEPKSPADLARHNCIGIRQGDEAYGLWRFTSPRGKSGKGKASAPTSESIKIRGNLTTNDGGIAVNWALDGHGVLLRAEWDVQRYLQSGRLVQLLQGYSSPDADIYAVYAQRHRTSVRVRALIDFVVAGLAG